MKGSKGTNKRIIPIAWHAKRMRGQYMTEDENKKITELIAWGKWMYQIFAFGYLMYPLKNHVLKSYNK